jgi:predicted RNA-binding protein YlqC (UPF0109 family)
VKELVEYMARAVVDKPDEVVVTERRSGDRIVFRLAVADEDRGKVIGKGGRIAQSMRALLKVAAVQQGARVQLEIGE